MKCQACDVTLQNQDYLIDHTGTLCSYCYGLERRYYQDLISNNLNEIIKKAKK